MANTLTIIKPGEDGYDESVGRSGRQDVTTPLLNGLVESALADGLTEFQLPDGAEFEGVDGKTHNLSVGMVRGWSADEKKFGPVAPAGKRFRISGGEGKNIKVTLIDATPAK